MKAIVCEMCHSNDVVKLGEYYVCQCCGTKYEPEAARKLMVEVEGTVEVKGSVQIDNSEFIEKSLVNARRAYAKEDWAEVERYYNLIEQNAPHNMEAVFFSAYGKVMATYTVRDTANRKHEFAVLKNSMSVINEYFEETSEDKKEVLNLINKAVAKMYTTEFVFENGSLGAWDDASPNGTRQMINTIREAFVVELKEIKSAHPELDYIDELIGSNNERASEGGCYVATCVYGSYDCPQVWTLRRFRDYELAETWHGRAFIKTYYAISPTLVKWFGETDWFKNMWRGSLNKLVAKCQSKGFNDTPYNDRVW